MPFPVAPAVALIAQAAPMEIVFWMSYISVKFPGDVDFHADQVEPPALPNIIIAALFVTVAIPDAVTVPELGLTFIVPGPTSKGAPLFTPEKAIIAPAVELIVPLVAPNTKV